MGRKKLRHLCGRGFCHLNPNYKSSRQKGKIPEYFLKLGIFQGMLLVKFSIVFMFLIPFFNQCAPYSLPEQKTYSEEDDPYTYYLQSTQAYNEQNYPLALENINKAILLNKDMAKFYQMKGEIYKAQANYSQALIAFDQALKKRSNFIAVHESIGEIYQAENQNEEAIRAYKRLLALEPQRIDIILRIVQCYLVLDELEVAQHHLDIYEKNAKDFKLSTDDNYYVLRGETLFRQDRFQESLDYLNKINKPSQKSLELQGLDYYHLDNYETGVSYFNKLLSTDKDNGKWYFYRGFYYFQKDDFNDALAQFKRALILDPDLTETRYYLGKIYLNTGEHAAALEELKQYRLETVSTEYIDEVDKLITELNQK